MEGANDSGGARADSITLPTGEVWKDARASEGARVEQRHCGLLIKKIDAMLGKTANASLKDLDVTISQVAALRAIEARPGHEAPFKQVERDLGVSQPTTAGILSRLREKGLIETYDSPTTLNAKVARLTEAGERVCGEAQVRMGQEDDRMLAGFSDEERAQFAGLLERVIENLDG